jgi:hypothetical protein
MPIYKVRPGHSCRAGDGSVKTPGEEVELGTDVAAAHPGAFEFVSDPDAVEAEPEAEHVVVVHKSTSVGQTEFVPLSTSA